MPFNVYKPGQMVPHRGRYGLTELPVPRFSCGHNHETFAEADQCLRKEREQQGKRIAPKLGVLQTV